jgi:hypothetical protein
VAKASVEIWRSSTLGIRDILLASRSFVDYPLRIGVISFAWGLLVAPSAEAGEADTAAIEKKLEAARIDLSLPKH